jgi:hypothetical protein
MIIEFETPTNIMDDRGRDLPLLRATFTLDLSRDTLTFSVHGPKKGERKDYAYKLTPLAPEPEPPPPERVRG